jgi:hypothetical protein
VLFGGECCVVALWLVSHSSEVPHTHQVNGTCACEKEEVIISRHNLDFDTSIFSVALLHKSWGKNLFNTDEKIANANFSSPKPLGNNPI